MHTDTALVLDRPEQLKALADDTRARILRILQTRSASAKELADLLEMTHGKVGHHIKVLRDAGMIEVVEERKVRAMTEKLYGLTYSRIEFAVPGTDRLGFTLSQAVREAATDQPFDPPAALLTARMSEKTAEDFRERLMTLVEEFGSAADEEGEIYGFVASVFATDTP